MAAGKDVGVRADEIILYEKLDNHDGEGINMLFGDSHVQFVLMGQAIEMLRAQGVDVP